MIRSLRRWLGIKTEAELQAMRERAAKQAAWDQQWREGLARYDAIYERLEKEPIDLAVLPDEIREKLAFLFADNNFNMSLTVGGSRGINADLYFTWRSGSVRTIFEEKDYGTEQFIRMCRAAYKYRDLLHERRTAALRKLVEDSIHI
jgi:hypothetical protein